MRDFHLSAYQPQWSASAVSPSDQRMSDEADEPMASGKYGRLPGGFTHLKVPRQSLGGMGLTEAKKWILAEIYTLQKKAGHCTASNAHFVALLEIEERQVSRHLSALWKAGHILVEDNEGGKAGYRKMRVSEDIAEVCREGQDDEFTMVPVHILRGMGLTPPQKRILSEICHLQNSDEGCSKPNSHFGSILEIGDRQVREYISTLRDAGYISIKDQGCGRNEARKLWVSEAIAEAWKQALPPADAQASASDDDLASGGSKLSAPTESPPKPKKKRNPTVEGHSSCELPDIIPRADWQAFVAMKHGEHGPFSEKARTGVINKLKQLHKDGYDCAKLLQLATDDCWRSV